MTVAAISSDNAYGYQMLLGGLTGGGGGCSYRPSSPGCMILASGGVACRGRALIRDVMVLGVAVSVVGCTLERGVIGMWTEKLYLSIYVAFVLIVLIADIYHRAVTVPHTPHEDAMRERIRQLKAERIATQRAGDTLNVLIEASAAVVEGGGGGGNGSMGGGSLGTKYDDRTHASAPPPGS